MSPKKKSNKQDNQTSVKPVLVLENSAANSKNHKLNGHSDVNHSIVQEAQGGATKSLTVVNGCNGNHVSDSSESSTSNLQVSSPEEVCSQTKQNESVEVLGASLNQIKISNDSLEPTVLLPPVLDGGSESQTDGASSPAKLLEKVTYVQYQSELQMPDIMRLIQKDLSEPYSIYTYRYFIHNWPMLCFLVRLLTSFI